jgi:hypothetical protein
MRKKIFSPGLNRIIALIGVALFMGMSSLSAKPDQKLTIRNHKGTLSEFFKEIEKQSDYRFFYNDELVRIEKEVYQLDVKNKSVDEVLTSLLAYTGLRYKKLDDNLIVISTMELLEDVNVKGSVVDAAGEPIIGANIIVKGSSSIGTITDAGGNFSERARQRRRVADLLHRLCDAGDQRGYATDVSRRPAGRQPAPG